MAGNDILEVIAIQQALRNDDSVPEVAKIVVGMAATLVVGAVLHLASQVDICPGGKE